MEAHIAAKTAGAGLRCYHSAGSTAADDALQQPLGAGNSLFERAVYRYFRTCVTGLVVYDTYTQFTTFGQLVIMLLIQTGGLGFMTLAVLFALITRKRIGLKERPFSWNRWPPYSWGAWCAWLSAF